MGRPTSADAAARPSGARVPHAPHRPKATYRFQLTQRANTTRAHVCELHGDSALRGDARHGPFPELVVCDLAPQAQAAVDASDDRQDRHEAAHVRVPGVRQAVVQQGLGHRDRAVAGRPGAGTRGRHRAPCGGLGNPQRGTAQRHAPRTRVPRSRGRRRAAGR